LKYYKGLKYQLAEDLVISIPIFGYNVSYEFISLTSDGLLTIKKGFCWDGASGAFDTKTIMKGSCIHDALYLLIRRGLIAKQLKKRCDRIMQNICLDAGMWQFRINYIGKALEEFGKKATLWISRRKIIEVN
jgi:hypothetical protein